MQRRNGPLSDERVERASLPDRGERTLWDPTMPGFGVRVRASGRKVFVLKTRDRYGQQVKLTIGSWPALRTKDARKIARDRMTALAAGGDPRERRHEATFGDAVNIFANVRLAQRSQRYRDETLRLLEHHCGRLHGVPLARLTRGELRRSVDTLVTDGKPGAATHLWAALSSLLSVAVDRELVSDHPLRGAHRPQPPAARDRTLDDLELGILWRASARLGHPGQSFVRLLTLTGCRRSEVAGLRREEIDRDRGWWTVPPERSNNGQPHRVRLTSPMMDELGGTAEPFPFLVSGTGQTPISGFSKLKLRLDRLIELERQAAGLCQPLAPWRWHDIRRSVASGMARLSVAPHVIERCLNHQGGQIAGVAAVYNRHRYDEEAARAWELWGGHIKALAVGGATVEPLARRA